MNHLLDAVEQSLDTKNYFAALAVSLALPDICGWVQAPSATSKARYIAWFTKYVQYAYTRHASIHMEEHIFLSGSD